MLPVPLALPTVRPTLHVGDRAVDVLTDQRPGFAGLVDRFGRVATDLRISLTDRCNLRCRYCMPAEGLDWLPSEKSLGDQEVIRLATIAVTHLGIREVRFTGGEPLLRRGLEGIVAATSALRLADGAPVTTSLTTNGLGLAHRARRLVAAGLTRVNVSLDTLEPRRYAEITRRDRFHDVLAGLAAARTAGLQPIKINAVLLRGVNDDETVALTRWALAEGYELRFIEQMPLGPRGAWTRDGMVTAEEILAALRVELDMLPMDPASRGNAPAQTWAVRTRDGLAGTVGVIASVTRPFCGECDRTRLTVDGQMRSCLFADDELDLAQMLRSGATDNEIAAAWRTGSWEKSAGHTIGQAGFHQPDRPMSAIGG